MTSVRGELLGEGRRAALAAVTLGAAVLSFVAGKAARDALFLSELPVSALPGMMAGAAAAALASSLVFARLMRSIPPQRLLPASMFGSALLHALQFGLHPSAPRMVAVVAYLHVAALVPLLISGVWSIVSELFDPRAAKRRVGQIASGGAVGGVLAGLVAERAGAWVGLRGLLGVIAVVSFAGFVLSLGLVRAQRAPASRPLPPTAAPPQSVPFLVPLVAVLASMALASNALDYVLKVEAVDVHESTQGLLRFFALFHAGVGLVTFVFQSTITRRALESFGLGTTAMSAPLSVMVGVVMVFLAPGFANIAALRGLETASRLSLFKSSYEVLFTPLTEGEKRGLKTLLDVTVERLSDMVAAGCIFLLSFALVQPRSALLGFALFFMSVAAAACRRVERGYVRVLQQRLVHEPTGHRPDILDRTTLRTLRAMAPPPPSAPVGKTSAIIELIMDGAREVDDEAFQILIDSLATERTPDDALRLLRTVADGRAPELSALLLDPATPEACRRRLPRVLSVSRRHEIVEALLSALDDERFDVRFQSGRALYRMAHRGRGLALPPARIHAAMRAELSSQRAVLYAEKQTELSGELPLEREFLTERANRVLEHVFRLLALVAPREASVAAFHALSAADPQLRGTALEWLDAVLPAPVREALLPHLDGVEPPPRSLRSPQKLMDELMAKSATVRMAAAKD